MKRFAIIAALCCLVLTPISVFAEDTGTYKIAEYDVKLTPRSDGRVEINYHQKWDVTGGHIPWMTVGVPNASFEIVRPANKGAIKDINADNSGGSYVRIDLDKDYKPGESFDVGFTIVQRQLFSADKDNYKMDFTPGWYDNAETGKLRLEVFFFAKLDTVNAQPSTFKQEGQSLVWERTNLAKGEKFNISVSFPKKSFPQEIAKDELKSDGSGIIFLIAGVAFIIIFFAVLRKIGMFRGGSGYGGGGGIFYGGSSGGGGRISSGGGGGFGGAASSCACACVSCACACACAGGGGAGCDRKLTHRCPLCRKCSRKHVCPIFKGASR